MLLVDKTDTKIDNIHRIYQLTCIECVGCYSNSSEVVFYCYIDILHILHKQPIVIRI
mgnify:CR=1 FL=1